MKADHERVTKLLMDTVTLLCKNGLSYDHELRIQGLLRITVDSNDVFLVSINDCFNCSSSDSPMSAPLSSSSSDAAGSGQSRKRSFDGIVDLTRLVETPQVHREMRPSQLPSSISPLHHGAQTRPRSAGSAGQNRSRAVTPSSSGVSMAYHSQHFARQPPLHMAMTTGHPSTTAVRRNSAEYSMPANAAALVDPSVVRPSQRPHAGYMDSIHNLMMTCERQLAPRCCPSGQHHKHLPPTAASGWSGTEQQESMQQFQLMHQNVAAVGNALATAAGTLETVGRSRADHFAFPLQSGRQAVPRNAYVQKSDISPSRYVYANAAVPGAINPPPMLSRQPCPDVTRPVYHDHSQYVNHLPQLYAAGAVHARQLVENTAMQPPAKRHIPNHLPRQALQPFNPAFIQSHPSHPHGCFPDTGSMPVNQQAHSVADPHTVSSLPLSSTATSQASCVTSSPVVKPPSSPVQSGRRIRPRPAEHIDLCNDDDDETADSGIHIPLSSIVIQPDNIDTAPERSNFSINTSESPASEFRSVSENSFSGTDLPPLTRILEIVPLDDGDGLEGGESSAVSTTVAAENTGQSAPASVSAVVVTSELSVSGRNDASDHQNLQSSAPLNASGDLLGMFMHTVTDSQLAQLSADEVTQMAELCFDTGTQYNAHM